VLDSVLAGASNLNFFGGSISNKTSRLYKRLVEGELCASVTGSLAASIDPYLYTLRATVRPDRDPGEVLEAFDIEIERLLHAPIQSTELEKAIKQARALFAYSSESITNQGFWMGYVEMFADYPWFDSFLDRLSQVTAEQALEAAQRYLLPKNRVVGIYYPSGGKSDA
jgi:zinc protease